MTTASLSNGIRSDHGMVVGWGLVISCLDLGEIPTVTAPSGAPQSQERGAKIWRARGDRRC
jgi:hypothetical protein